MIVFFVELLIPASTTELRLHACRDRHVFIDLHILVRNTKSLSLSLVGQRSDRQAVSMAAEKLRCLFAAIALSLIHI